MAINKASYSSSVFINCPFDDGYNSIFEAIVFTICDCGFSPRCAKERSDDSEQRIHKIYEIIQECKYGIHDISFAGMDPKTKLARFNMPYELGLFIGCKRYGIGKQKKKSCRILDAADYRYQRFISDINGQDICTHQKKPQRASEHVRNFLVSKTNSKSIPTASFIWNRYNEYRKKAPKMAKKENWNVKELTYR